MERLTSRNHRTDNPRRLLSPRRNPVRVARGHPALSLQQKVGNRSVTEIFEACKKQDTELLPGGVGIVERGHRESVLREMLGKERAGFEAEIRGDWRAREFVCEAGLSAMMALFYTRTRNRDLDVARARASLTSHPHFYSAGAFDALKTRRAYFKEFYGIELEAGDKPWSPEDVSLLGEALRALTDRESQVLRGYRFIRWSSRCNELLAADPKATCDLRAAGTCGMHFGEPTARTVTMYDCAKFPTDTATSMKFKGRPGADTLLHEIGHIMMIGRMKLATDKQKDAKLEHQRIRKQADSATGSARTELESQAAAAKKRLDEADKAVLTLMSAKSNALDEFSRLVKGRPHMTPYSKEGPIEAFAEAFMIFKLAPDKLKALNEPLFNWFEQGKFL